MFPVMTTEGGQCMAFPDVCLTQTGPVQVPIPYPNIAMCSDGKCSEHVTIRNAAVMRKGDTISTSSGDEPSLQGVISAKKKGKAEIQLGWSKVKVEGKDVGYLTAMTAQNGASPWNIPPGVHAIPSQTSVWVRIMFAIRSPKDWLVAHLQKWLPCSPLLRDQITTLQSQGWKFVVDDAPGACANRASKVIRLNREMLERPNYLMATVAHEVGHALYKMPPQVYTKGMSGQEFMDRNNARHGMDEGMAEVNAGKVAAQVRHLCRQELELDPFTRQTMDGAGTDAEKARRIGDDIMRNARTSTTKEPYWIYYGRKYSKTVHSPANAGKFSPPFPPVL